MKKMKEMKKTINEIVYISSITKVTKKRLRIFLSVLLSNSTVLLDISIIIFFSYILTGEVTDNRIINFFVERIYFLPIIVVLRFTSNFVERINIYNQEEFDYRLHKVQM